MDEKLIGLLYRSFDTELHPEELKILEKGLSESEELREEKQKITLLRQNIVGQRKAAFKPFFVERVMNRIELMEKTDEQEILFNSLYKLFRPLAIAAAVLIIVISGYNIISSGEVSIESALAVPEVTLDDIYSPSYALLMEEDK